MATSQPWQQGHVISHLTARSNNYRRLMIACCCMQMVSAAISAGGAARRLLVRSLLRMVVQIAKSMLYSPNVELDDLVTVRRAVCRLMDQVELVLHPAWHHCRKLQPRPEVSSKHPDLKPAVFQDEC